jgi:hypothetical protein
VKYDTEKRIYVLIASAMTMDIIHTGEFPPDCRSAMN